MTAYAPNFTSQYRVFYRVFNRRFSVGFRFTSEAPVPPSSVANAVVAILNASAPIRYAQWAIENVTWRAAGSDVSVPLDVPTVTAGGAGNTPANVSGLPAYISWLGRTFGGSRVAVFLFGTSLTPWAITPANDYRLTTAENTTVAAVRTALINAGAAGLCGIDGGAVAWRNYANLGVNSYLTRKARGEA